MKLLYQNKLIILSILAVTASLAAGQTARCNGGVNCIPVKDCSGLYDRLVQGTTPALTRLLRSLHCGFQSPEEPLICCPPEFLPASQSRAFDPSTLLPSPRICGIQEADRIVGGTRTEIDEHPWMALLRYDKSLARSDWGFYCGGVLISPRYVLTAAHCVKGADLPKSWKLTQVRFGEWNTSTTIDCIKDDCNVPPIDVPVEQIIAHENYDPLDTNQYHDIALIRLASEVPITDFVKPICLPLSSELKRSSFLDYDLDVAGWGKTETRSESDVKLKVRVPVVSLSSCASVYQRVGRQLADTQLCAGGISGQDSCRGDSGGALMGQTRSAENWFAVGVVSYGPSPCGSKGWPGVYTRVGAYTDWILSKLRP